MEEKLDELRRAEAKASTAGQRFELKQEIAEVKSKIAELEGASDGTKSRAADHDEDQSSAQRTRGRGLGMRWLGWKGLFAAIAALVLVGLGLIAHRTSRSYWKSQPIGTHWGDPAITDLVVIHRTPDSPKILVTLGGSRICVWDTSKFGSSSRYEPEVHNTDMFNPRIDSKYILFNTGGESQDIAIARYVGGKLMIKVIPRPVVRFGIPPAVAREAGLAEPPQPTEPIPIRYAVSPAATSICLCYPEDSAQLEDGHNNTVLGAWRLDDDGPAPYADFKEHGLIDVLPIYISDRGDRVVALRDPPPHTGVGIPALYDLKNPAMPTNLVSPKARRKGQAPAADAAAKQPLEAIPKEVFAVNEQVGVVATIEESLLNQSHTIYFWDLRKGDQLGQFPVPNSYRGYTPMFVGTAPVLQLIPRPPANDVYLVPIPDSAESARYESSGWKKYPRTYDGRVLHTAWNVLIRIGATGVTVLPLQNGQQSSIQGIDLSAGSDFMVTSDGATLIHLGDQRIEMFDLSTGNRLGWSPLPTGIRTYHEDVDRNLVVVIESSEAIIYSTRNGSELARLANIGATPPIVHFDPKTKGYFALTSVGTLLRYDYGTEVFGVLFFRREPPGLATAEAAP